MSENIKPGDLVVLICPFHEPNLPPVGARGLVVYDDFDGEVGVVFEGFPCEAGPGPDWITPKVCLAKTGIPAWGHEASRDGFLEWWEESQ